MHTRLSLSWVAAIAITMVAPAAYANPIAISTDRVQIQVGENGSVQIRTSGDRPLVLNSPSTPSDSWPSARLTTVPFGQRCFPQSQTHQRHTTHSTSSGDRIYSESRTSTRVCQ